MSGDKQQISGDEFIDAITAMCVGSEILFRFYKEMELATELSAEKGKYRLEISENQILIKIKESK